MLTKYFYELYEAGFIYDEDENGLNMSYGEYAAIQDAGREKLRESLENAENKLDFLEKLQDLLDGADDDAKMFFGLDDWYVYIDDENVDNSEIPEDVLDMFNELEY